ncbi:uncharacterized protein SPAPADRAFT_62570, partial [Spathaspora passalidarum NRRL Y-27907]
MDNFLVGENPQARHNPHAPMFPAREVFNEWICIIFAEFAMLTWLTKFNPLFIDPPTSMFSFQQLFYYWQSTVFNLIIRFDSDTLQRMTGLLTQVLGRIFNLHPELEMSVTHSQVRGILRSFNDSRLSYGLDSVIWISDGIIRSNITEVCGSNVGAGLITVFGQELCKISDCDLDYLLVILKNEYQSFLLNLRDNPSSFDLTWMNTYDASKWLESKKVEHIFYCLTYSFHYLVLIIGFVEILELIVGIWGIFSTAKFAFVKKACLGL